MLDTCLVKLKLLGSFSFFRVCDGVCSEEVGLGVFLSHQKLQFTSHIINVRKSIGPIHELWFLNVTGGDLERLSKETEGKMISVYTFSRNIAYHLVC